MREKLYVVYVAQLRYYLASLVLYLKGERP